MARRTFIKTFVAGPPFSLLHRPSIKTNIQEYLAILGHGQVPFYYRDDKQILKLNALGHSLGHYVRGIQSSPGAKLMEIPRWFLSANSSKPISSECLAMMEKSKIYPANHKPGTEESEALKQKWAEGMSAEEVILDKIQRLATHFAP